MACLEDLRHFFLFWGWVLFLLFIHFVLTSRFPLCVFWILRVLETKYIYIFFFILLCQTGAYWCCTSVVFSYFNSFLGHRMLVSLLGFNVCSFHIDNIASMVMSLLPTTTSHSYSEISLKKSKLSLSFSVEKKRGWVF